MRNTVAALSAIILALGAVHSTAAAEASVAQFPPLQPGSSEDFRVNVGDRVFFADNSADLSIEAISVIGRQAAWLRRHPETRIRVQGNTDEAGAPAFNLELGERRAAVVAVLLIMLGVDRDRMEIQSNGDTRQLDPRDNDEARSVNRNVHIEIVAEAGS